MRYTRIAEKKIKMINFFLFNLISTLKNQLQILNPRKEYALIKDSDYFVKM